MEMRWPTFPSGAAPGQFGDSAGLVPIRNKDVPLGIDEAAVGSAEDGCLDVVWIKIVLCPLRLLRIVAQKSNRHVVAIENGNPSFQL